MNSFSASVCAAARDSRIDPAIGDVFAHAGDCLWRVLDVFYSVDYETGRHRGLLIETMEGQSTRRVWVSLEQFRRRAQHVQPRSKALTGTDWTCVRSIAAPLVCAAMLAGHWPPIAVSSEL